MMNRTIAWTPAAILSLGLAACSGGGLGGLGDILGGGTQQPQNGVLTVEVQDVRTSSQEILVRTEDGQQGAILYDQNTQVVYENQQYAVTALDPGDIVDMRIQQVQQGYYTDLVQVRTPVQERQGGTTGSGQTGVYQVEGTIGEIDLQQWMFTLNMTQGGTLPVYLPSSAPASTRDRLRQYQPGDYVRVEVRALDQQRGELVRWGWSD
jgi:exosome complex RNA-binding protein Csl4